LVLPQSIIRTKTLPGLVFGNGLDGRDWYAWFGNYCQK
jgi:hypothetical protein